MKYKSKPCELNGQKYRSQREMKRHQELMILESVGAIIGLQREVPFLLTPSRRRPDGVIERGCKYIADFVYLTSDGQRVVEDVKSHATVTKDYVLKRKMMLHFHGIAIKEVYQ